MGWNKESFFDQRNFIDPSQPALNIPFLSLFPYPALTIHFPVNLFPKELAPKVTNTIIKNGRSCTFVSFLIALVISLNKALESSIARSIFIISFISSFESIKVAVPERCIFFWIPASIAEAAAVIANGTEMSFCLWNCYFH